MTKLTILVSILASVAAGILAITTGAFASAAVPARIDYCAPLPPPAGPTVIVSNVAELVDAVNQAAAGTAILLQDGTYALDGAYLRLAQPEVTVRSASGNREADILDGNYVTTEIFQVVASGVTLADITLERAYDHPVHVMSASGSATDHVLLYNLHIIDPGQQAVKINPDGSGFYPDLGEIACSLIELTDAGRSQIRDDCYTGGIDGHQSSGWHVRDNPIAGFWCTSGLSEHAIHFWRDSRDTLVERNHILNNARDIGFGLATEGDARTYPDDPCPQTGGSYVDHYGGVIRNNIVFADSADLFVSQYGFDCGICLWTACEAQVLHNTVFSTQAPFSAIEWRFSNTWIDLTNNLVSGPLRERDVAHAVPTGNVTGALASWFQDAAAGDLHLAVGAVQAIDQGAPVQAGLCDGDIDGDSRPVGPVRDVGVDEVADPTIADQFTYLPLLAR
jgi:hypothetical protein